MSNDIFSLDIDGLDDIESDDDEEEQEENKEEAVNPGDIDTITMYTPDFVDMVEDCIKFGFEAGEIFINDPSVCTGDVVRHSDSHVDKSCVHVPAQEFVYDIPSYPHDDVGIAEQRLGGQYNVADVDSEIEEIRKSWGDALVGKTKNRLQYGDIDADIVWVGGED